MSIRMRAADIMDRAGKRTLEAEAEQIRWETRSRFSGFILERTNPGSRFRNRSCVPPDRQLFSAASELGLLQFALPSEIGGAGRDKFDWGIVIMELAHISRDPGLPVLLDITVENAELILSSGRPELIDRYVPDLVAGRRFAAQAAYESRDPYDYQTTARQVGDGWILNGAKRFVAGAAFADTFITYLRDETTNDMLAFLVERDDPGVAATRLETMGLRSMGFGQIMLHDVHLPQWRLIWRSDALSELNTYARNRRMLSACGVVGAIEGVAENCVETLADRKRSGRRVLDFPNVERSVGEMRVLLETARSIVYRALDGTRAADRDAYFDEIATSAKHHVSECAMRVGQLVMNLQGGESYMSVFPWEQFMRDVLGLIGGQGSQELLLIQLGQRTIVGLEGRRLREEGAERNLAKLADAWWALAALCAPGGVAEAEVQAVLTAAKLTVGRAEAKALLDRAYALLDGSQPEVFAGVPGFAAVALAAQSGLLGRLTQPHTRQEIAPHADLIDVLVKAQVVRVQDDDSYSLAPGLERLFVGGPRTLAFAEKIRRTLNGVAPQAIPAGCGDDAPLLADVLANKLIGRMEGLEELLDRPGMRIACAAKDDGRAAAALAREIPITPVVPLDSADQVALVWTPAVELKTMIATAVRALIPGGWLVVTAPVAPKRTLGAAVARLEQTLSGAYAGDFEQLLRDNGLGHVRVLWEDVTLGLRLIVGRRPS